MTFQRKGHSPNWKFVNGEICVTNDGKVSRRRNKYSSEILLYEKVE